jgi:hypothetical protein
MRTGVEDEEGDRDGLGQERGIVCGPYYTKPGHQRSEDSSTKVMTTLVGVIQYCSQLPHWGTVLLAVGIRRIDLRKLYHQREYDDWKASSTRMR